MSEPEENPAPAITLDEGAPMRAYQRYVHDLETMHGWLDVDLVHNCFLLGEEMGELFKAVRRVERLFDEAGRAPVELEQRRAEVGDEVVDVLNYLLAIANRLDIDVEAAFRKKNTENQARTWD